MGSRHPQSEKTEPAAGCGRVMPAAPTPVHLGQRADFPPGPFSVRGEVQRSPSDGSLLRAGALLYIPLLPSLRSESAAAPPRGRRVPGRAGGDGEAPAAHRQRRPAKRVRQISSSAPRAHLGGQAAVGNDDSPYRPWLPICWRFIGSLKYREKMVLSEKPVRKTGFQEERECLPSPKRWYLCVCLYIGVYLPAHAHVHTHMNSSQNSQGQPECACDSSAGC